jgi:hypothetical protein
MILEFYRSHAEVKEIFYVIFPSIFQILINSRLGSREIYASILRTDSFRVYKPVMCQQLFIQILSF